MKLQQGYYMDKKSVPITLSLLIHRRHRHKINMNNEQILCRPTKRPLRTKLFYAQFSQFFITLPKKVSLRFLLTHNDQEILLKGIWSQESAKTRAQMFAITNVDGAG